MNKEKDYSKILKVRIDDKVKVKDKEWYLDLKFVILTFISLIALLFSLGVFSKSDLRAYSNGAYIFPGIAPALGYPNFDNHIITVNFLIPIEFTNKGLKSDIVRNINLMVSHNNITLEYKQDFELDISRVYDEGYWKDLSYLLNNQPFFPFEIDGKSSITKIISFSRLPGEGIQMPLEVGNYSLGIFLNTSHYYKNVYNITLDLRPLTVESIKEGGRVFVTTFGRYYIRSYLNTS